MCFETSQNSQENTCVEAFLKKVLGLSRAPLFKIDSSRNLRVLLNF